MMGIVDKLYNAGTGDTGNQGVQTHLTVSLPRL